MEKQSQDDSREFQRLQEGWRDLFNELAERASGVYKQECEEYARLKSAWTVLFNKMGERIYKLDSNNRSYQQHIQHFEKEVQCRQEKIQQLQASLKILNNEKERLNTKYTEALSKLAQLNRVSTRVYTAGKSFQPVTVGRDYSEFVEQTIPSCIRMILKYLQEETPTLSERVKANEARNRILSVITHDILSVDLEDKKMLDELPKHIYQSLNIPISSFSEVLNKELEDLIQGGQALAEAISQSGGKLVFYENEQFDEKYHEMVGGSSSTDTTIHYTITPAYVVKLVSAEEALDEDVLVKAKVVMHDSQTTDNP